MKVVNAIMMDVSRACDCEDSVVLRSSSTLSMSLRVRISVLETCKVENVMDSWADRDSVENGSDSYGYHTSDCGVIDALIFLRLLYSGSCSN